MTETLAVRIARLRRYAEMIDGDANADCCEPNLREDIEAICSAADRAAIVDDCIDIVRQWTDPKYRNIVTSVIDDFETLKSWDGK